MGLGRFAESRPLYGASAVLLESLPFRLVACVGRRLGGVLRVAALLSLGRVRYRRRSFNIAQSAQDFLL
jgi:hypothetical protein